MQGGTCSTSDEPLSHSRNFRGHKMLGSREAHLIIWPFGTKSHPHHSWVSATGLKSLGNNCKRKRKRIGGLVPHFCTRDNLAGLVDLLLDSSPAAGSSTRPPRAWLASWGQSTGSGRASVALFLSTHRTATQSRSPRSLSPWPGSLCANGHVCQVNSLCRTAVTPSPSPRSLSHFSVYLLSRGGRATARTRPPAIALPPSLSPSIPPRYRRRCAPLRGLCRCRRWPSSGVRPSVLRADGGRAGARTSHMPVCHPQAHPRLSQSSLVFEVGGLAEMDTRIP